MKTKFKYNLIEASIDRPFIDSSFIGTEPTPKQEIILDKINPKTGLISKNPIINIVIMN